MELTLKSGSKRSDNRPEAVRCFQGQIFVPFHTVHGAHGKDSEVVCHSRL